METIADVSISDIAGLKIVVINDSNMSFSDNPLAGLRRKNKINIWPTLSYAKEYCSEIGAPDCVIFNISNNNINTGTPMASIIEAMRDSGYSGMIIVCPVVNSGTELFEAGADEVVNYDEIANILYPVCALKE